MVIKKNQLKDKTIIDLVGEFDDDSTAEFQDVLLSELENSKHIELNFAGVELITSLGLSALLSVFIAATNRGAELPLSNVSTFVMNTLEMFGFTEEFTIIS